MLNIKYLEVAKKIKCEEIQGKEKLESLNAHRAFVIMVMVSFIRRVFHWVYTWRMTNTWHLVFSYLNPNAVSDSIHMFSWLWSVFDFFGLTQKSGKILFLGLDNAGKTTLLHMLKDDFLGKHVPTFQPTIEELIMGNIKFKTVDLGGHEEARRLWSNYYAVADCIIYIVDTADPERLAESKEVLDGVLQAPELQEVPILILGNKIDIGNLGENDLKSILGVHRTTGKDNQRLPQGMRPIEIFMCSIQERMGYGDGIRWLSNYL